MYPCNYNGQFFKFTYLISKPWKKNIAWNACETFLVIFKSLCRSWICIPGESFILIFSSFLSLCPLPEPTVLTVKGEALQSSSTFIFFYFSLSLVCLSFPFWFFIGFGLVDICRGRCLWPSGGRKHVLFMEKKDVITLFSTVMKDYDNYLHCFYLYIFLIRISHLIHFSSCKISLTLITVPFLHNAGTH